jgi:2-oxoglutarate ferredoxin oxidoreductase subunit alpha
MNKDLVKEKKDFSIVLCGEAGQGIQTVEHILIGVMKLSGFNVFSTSEFMSRIRGGCNSTEIRISSSRVNAFLDRIDVLVCFDRCAMLHLKERISPKTIIIGEKEIVSGITYKKQTILEVPFSKIAQGVGSKVFINTVAAGLVAGLFKIDPQIIDLFLKGQFGSKGEEIVNKNIEAGRNGYEIGHSFIGRERVNFEMEKQVEVKEEVLLSGTEAISLGAIAGGCQFLSFYPMSPSTGVAFFWLSKLKCLALLLNRQRTKLLR